ncbi:MAG: rhodanese-like domain-containing protein [Chromatiales bacterium]|nr:rhodanese-like domain-containing protein [Chromatiales bacterium]
MPLQEFVTANWELFLALVVILALLFNNLFAERLRGYQSVDPGGAVNLINHEDALYLDVRTDGEISEGRVINSLHIPLSALKSRLGELEKHRQRPIVVGCRSGHRSGVACGQLRKAGYEKVYNLKGGILAWRAANLPVTRKG